MVNFLWLIFGLSISVALQGNTVTIDKRPTSSTQAKAIQDLELKLARLWGKYDEMELKVRKQAERIKLLEKGLMLGVIPQELIQDKLKLGSDSSEAIDWSNRSQTKPPPVATETPKKAEEVPFPELLKRAQAAFDAGKYGKAISLYQRIDASYKDYTAEGQTLYWIGLSWYYLKEYNQSAGHFNRLVENFKESKWIPKAEYFLAKISLQKGLLRKALDQLRDIVGRYPNSDISEMASHEIKLLKEKI
ncbi:MAG: tetratricopeptide repeat protein [Pseudobacteriovorax sp.]|nr:tetratricopeptide repeat protein [Pseudobacteriovorax sp.]